jgi:hypothetical protein
MKIWITQVKNSVGSLTKRLNHTEDKISGLKDKVEEIEHIPEEKY